MLRSTKRRFELMCETSAQIVQIYRGCSLNPSNILRKPRRSLAACFILLTSICLTIACSKFCDMSLIARGRGKIVGGRCHAVESSPSRSRNCSKSTFLRTEEKHVQSAGRSCAPGGEVRAQVRGYKVRFQLVCFFCGRPCVTIKVLSDPGSE